jgi:hypothetical protein
MAPSKKIDLPHDWKLVMKDCVHTITIEILQSNDVRILLRNYTEFQLLLN